MIIKQKRSPCGEQTESVSRVLLSSFCQNKDLYSSIYSVRYRTAQAAPRTLPSRQ